MEVVFDASVSSGGFRLDDVGPVERFVRLSIVEAIAGLMIMEDAGVMESLRW